MRKCIFLLLLILPLSIILVNCSSENAEEAARKAELERMKEFNEGVKLQFYRAIKIALRSTAVAGKNPEFDKARQDLLKIGGEALSIAGGKDSVSLNPLELLGLASDLYKAKDIVLKTDEDSLPTILGNIMFVINKGQSSEPPPVLGTLYTKDFEHGLIGTSLWASHVAPSEFAMYEFTRTNEDKLGSDDLALAMKLAKSFAFWQHDFPYQGMDKGTEFLALCEKNKAALVANPVLNFSETETSGEKIYWQLHGMGHLARGLNEKKLKKEEESMNDFEEFVEDAERGGFDNELVWLVGSYVYIKKEDKEKSLMYLTKLEKSEFIEAPEKQAIAETKKYIESRDNTQAMNTLNDKVAIGKIAVKFVYRRMEHLKELQKLKETKEGARMLEIQKSLSEKAATMDKVSGNLNTDSLTSKAGELVKGLFGK